jgi:hypothetical protein
MKAFERNTRLKLSTNPTGELFKLLIPYLKKNFAARLRAFRAAACIFLLPFAASCVHDDIVPQGCIGGECNAIIDFGIGKDINGFYHVKLDWNREYLPYFTIKASASRIPEEHHYNKVPYVSADFDSDTFWVIGEGVTYREPLYNPFNSTYTSSGTMLPSQVTQVTVNTLKGTKVNVVQSTEIYFREDQDGSFSTYRTVGPFPPELKNDTITIFMRVFWDMGGESVIKDHFVEKFIVE